MVRQSNPRDNLTANSVLDALNSGEESSSDNNESDECDNTSNVKINEERIKQGGTDIVSKEMNLPLAAHHLCLVCQVFYVLHNYQT